VLFGEPALAGPPFAVDDPGTVEKWHATLLARYELVHRDGTDTHSVPAATLTLGLPAKLEFAIDGAVQSSEVPGAADVGFGDLSLVLKWRFWEQDGAVPAFALAYALRLPTGDEGFSGEASVHSPYLAIGWQIGERWQVFADLGTNSRDRGEEDPQFFAGAALGCQVTELWLIGLDLLGHTHVGHAQRSDLLIGLATQLDLSQSWSLLARVGGSTFGREDLNVSAGLQWNY
jgi:outer membrane putative beta-barrel porin/alpha-amylase